MDAPGETATLDLISISDTSSVSQVFAGPGVPVATWTQVGGENVLQAAATVTSVTVAGGTLTTEGDYTITTLAVSAGTLNANHVKTGGNAITTLTLTGGTCTAIGSARARTWSAVTLSPTATLIVDGAIVTITTFNDGAGRYKYVASVP